MVFTLPTARLSLAFGFTMGAKMHMTGIEPEEKPVTDSASFLGASRILDGLVRNSSANFNSETVS